MPRIVYTSAKVPIHLEDKPLGVAGGEGTVYRVSPISTSNNSCVKIYHQHKRTEAKKCKIEFMIKNKPPVVSTSSYVICWPTETIYNSIGNFLGFLMPCAYSGSEKLYELTNINTPKRLQIQWSKFDRSKQSGIENRLKICVNIAIAIHSIHQGNKYVIVDYKPQNILISIDGKVSIIDVDSFQIVNNGKILFYSGVATPEYAPPESAKINSSKSLISESWDRFSLAISFYEILFGIHPYVATSVGQYQSSSTLGEKIQNGLFVHGSKKTYLTEIPSFHNNFQNLPISLRQLFIKAFEEGHTNNDARPTAEQWGKTIYEELVTKTGIKSNTIVSFQKTHFTPSTKTLKPSTKTPYTITNTQPIVKGPITSKKEDYMIWKISTAILVVICAVLFYKGDLNNTQLNTLRNKLVQVNSQNSTLKRDLNEIRETSNNNNASVNQKISSLQSALTSIADKYPITLQSVSFVSVEGGVTSVETHTFNKYERFIKPIIRYRGNTQVNSVCTIYYRIFDPNNRLLSQNNSPSGYTWDGAVYSKNNFATYNLQELGAYGDINSYSFYQSGRYKVDFWCNGIMIGESYFDTN
jgi:hypothetical protein